VTLDTSHTLELVPTTTAASTFGRPPTPPPSGSFHTVTFLRRSNNWVHPRGEASPSTFVRLDVVAVHDEQGNDVRFASRNNAVQGGGVAHVVNAVSTQQEASGCNMSVLQKCACFWLSCRVSHKLPLPLPQQAAAAAAAAVCSTHACAAYIL
jgi:hypothetical protein